MRMHDCNEEMDDIAMHFVMVENKYTVRLVKKLAGDGEIFTLVDSRYIGMQRKGKVTYVNMELARQIFDLPDRLYSTSKSERYVYQEFKENGNFNKYIRHANNDNTWSNWMWYALETV